MALNHSNGRDLYDSSISSKLRAMEELTWIQIMVIVSNWNIGFLPTCITKNTNSEHHKLPVF